MNLKLHIALIIGVLFYFQILFSLLKKNRVALRYTLLWIISGIVLLIIATFPNLVTMLAFTIGIIEPVNAIYLIVLACVIMILISITSIVSGQNQKIKSLIQIVALLDKKVNSMEKQLQNKCDDSKEDTE